MKTRLLIGANEGVGVQAHHQADGPVRYYWVHLRKSRTGVNIVRQGEADSVDELTKAIDPRFPLALVILHERIMLRSTSEPFRSDRDLQRWLPNVQAQEFAVDAFAIGSGSVVAVARQAMLTGTVDPLAAAGYRIVSLHLGPWVAFALRDHWREEGASFQFGEHGFTCGPDGTWSTAWQASQEPATAIGSEHVAAGSALAMAALWQHWFGAVPNEEPAVPCIARARTEERFRLLYERASLIVVALLLTLFGGDVWLRSQLADDSAELHAALEQQAAQERSLDSLRSGLSERRSLLNGSGFAQSGRDMRALDEVAASVPSAVHLTELWMAPTQGTLRAGEPFERRGGVLAITGTTPDAASIPEWVDHLNAMACARSARLLSLEQRPQEASLLFRIELELR